MGCIDVWEEHYNNQPKTINTNVWDAVKSRSDLSRFVDLMIKNKYDTLFLKKDTYTLFIPDNAAFEKMQNASQSDTTILNYHISRHLIQPVNITGTKKIQTLAEKFSTFENNGSVLTFDGIKIKEESALYINGKFLIMEEVAIPRLNLFEYFSIFTPPLKTYIVKHDSIIIDREKSRPLGFDKNGNTVYDTVSIKVNTFEMEYFPVSEEFRNRTATFVFPTQAKYEEALTTLAGKLGGNFHSYADIPVKWQEDILIPHLVKHGTFLNMLKPYEFRTTADLTSSKKFNMLNIQGDSIVVDYLPTGEYLCSNGIFYDYTDFSIPDSLILGSNKFEGEWLARSTGANKYAWKNDVTVTGTSSFDVENIYNSDLSNDSILVVYFPKGYKGEFKVQFKVKDLFPRKYRVVVSTHMDIGGIYDISVNGQLVKTFNYYDYVKGRGIIKSVTGTNFIPNGRYNKFDFYLDIITEYDKPLLQFEYKGSGSTPGNGLAIDVIEFILVEN